MVWHVLSVEIHEFSADLFVHFHPQSRPLAPVAGLSLNGGRGLARAEIILLIVAVLIPSVMLQGRASL